MTKRDSLGRIRRPEQDAALAPYAQRREGVRKVTVTLPEDLLEQLDAISSPRGRSQAIETAVREFLKRAPAAS